MAPEQFVGTMRIDTRTDVWAMGVCIYKLLTAKFPFDGSNLMRVCSRVLGKPPVPPRELVPDLPEAVDALVMRCLQREPDARFADGNELRVAIESLIPPAPDRDLDTARIDVAPPAAPAPGKPAPMPMLAQPTAAPVPAQPAAPAYRTDEPHSVPIRQAPEKARWPWWAPIALVAVLAVGGLLVFVLGWRAPSTTAAGGDRAPAPPTIDLPPPSVPTATPLATATLAPSASASDTPPVAGSAPKASDASPKRAAPSRPLKGGRGTAPSATTTGDLYDKM
jgi:serine/threonine-protein kinase